MCSDQTDQGDQTDKTYQTHRIEYERGVVGELSNMRNLKLQSVSQPVTIISARDASASENVII